MAWKTSRGAPFIQHLCEQLDINAFEDDLQSILNSVKLKVSTKYESKHEGNEDLDGKKCMPSIACDNLTRKIKFSQKTFTNL